MTTLIGHKVNSSLTATELTQGRGFGLGDMTDDGAGNTYIFVKASAALGAGDCAAIDVSYVAKGMTITVGKTPIEVGFAQVAIAAEEYGWVLTGGRGIVTLLADADQGVPLYATATAGALDDAIVSVQIAGVVCVSSATGATTDMTCVIRFPHVVQAAAAA